MFSAIIVQFQSLRQEKPTDLDLGDVLMVVADDPETMHDMLILVERLCTD